LNRGPIDRIHSLQTFDEGRYEVLARLFTISDDLQSGSLLFENGHSDRVALGLGELFPILDPPGPQLIS